MDRRDFVTAGTLWGLGLGFAPGVVRSTQAAQESVRAMFPRLRQQTFLNGAGGTPLGAFGERAIQRYTDFARLGPEGGHGAYFNEVWTGVRGRFAELIGADESEVGLVECTKAGEQIVIEGLGALRRGGNVVTNDLHFSGSLHNYEGLRRTGVDVRVVRSRDFRVSLDRMADAIDARTELVAVSLVSNVNGHVEPMAELASVAHERGALVFADIIQAAGAIPVDVRAMGIDVAACSSYKWLFGIHGAGFLYVRRDVQGVALPDRLFPGHVRRNYAPFVAEPDPEAGAFTYAPPGAATRYQPGHVSYLGYAVVHEGLGFLAELGLERVAAHGAALRGRLLEQVDPDAYRVLTPDPGRSPILAFEVRHMDGLLDRLIAADVVVGLGGDKWNLLRVSPAIYNTEADVDRLAEVLRG